MTNYSIHTNIGAQVALSSLSTTQTKLGKVQAEVSTGYKVSKAQDNAAVFAVAQGVRADLAAYDSVNTALGDASSLATVSISGVTSISNLLTNITQSLTELADGSISEGQRQTYTSDLKSQIDEVQTFIQGATYNGVNLIGANQGTYGVTGLGYTAFTAPSDISVLSGLNGGLLTLHAVDLTGGTAGTDGFLGLARLTYLVGTGPFAGASFQNTVATAPLSNTLISRSEIQQNEAIAALAPVSNSASAYFLPGATAGTTSVFGAAIANFTAQVNSALGSLGADNSNISSQITFVQSLSDASNSGLGNLVDANLAHASAQLTALQTQQQLAGQALSIANAQSQNILSLYRQ